MLYSEMTKEQLLDEKRRLMKDTMLLRLKISNLI